MDQETLAKVLLECEKMIEKRSNYQFNRDLKERMRALESRMVALEMAVREGIRCNCEVLEKLNKAEEIHGK